LVSVGPGKLHRIDPGPPSELGLMPFAVISAASAVICGWYWPTSNNLYNSQHFDIEPFGSHKMDDSPCYEGPKDLREDIVWDLLPRKALPDSKADRNRRVEVSTTCSSTGNDREGDTNRISPTYLEERTIYWLRSIQEEGCC
jgi:hypothetical protein